MSDDDEPLFTPYRVPEDNDDHPINLYTKLIQLDEHEHFKDLRVEFLFKVDPIVKGGMQILGAVHIPTVQGKLKDLFEMLLGQFFGRMPEFLIILDGDFWSEATPHQREALLFHEMMHVKQEVDKFGELAFDRDGNPKFGLREHDVSAFNAEVQRYGAWHDGLVNFLAAAANTTQA